MTGARSFLLSGLKGVRGQEGASTRSTTVAERLAAAMPQAFRLADGYRPEDLVRALNRFSSDTVRAFAAVHEALSVPDAADDVSLALRIEALEQAVEDLAKYPVHSDYGATGLGAAAASSATLASTTWTQCDMVQHSDRLFTLMGKLSWTFNVAQGGNPWVEYTLPEGVTAANAQYGAAAAVTADTMQTVVAQNSVIRITGALDTGAGPLATWATAFLITFESA